MKKKALNGNGWDVRATENVVSELNAYGGRESTGGQKESSQGVLGSLVVALGPVLNEGVRSLSFTNSSH